MIIGATMTWLPLILVVLFAIVGVFALAVALTINKKTRAVGAVLLALMLGAGFLMVLAAGWLLVARKAVVVEDHQTRLREQMWAQQAHQEAIRHATGEGTAQSPFAELPKTQPPPESHADYLQDYYTHNSPGGWGEPAWVKLWPVVLLLAIAAIVAMLVNRKTRTAGVILLTLGGGGAAILVFGLLFSAPHSTVAYPRSMASNSPVIAQMPHPDPIPVETAKPADGSTEPPLAESTAAEANTEDAKPDEIALGEAKPEEKPVEPKPAPAKPDWVGMKPQVVGNVYRVCVAGGPYSNAAECLQETSAAIRYAFDEYVGICLGAEWAGRIDLPSELRPDRVVKRQWDETVQTSYGPMVQRHLLVEFDRKLKDRIHQEQSRVIIAGRLWRCAAILGGVLALLGVAYVGLRVDLETAGRYRGRILIAIAVAAAGFVAAAWHLPQLWLPLAAGLMSITVQLASPWVNLRERG